MALYEIQPVLAQPVGYTLGGESLLAWLFWFLALPFAFVGLVCWAAWANDQSGAGSVALIGFGGALICVSIAYYLDRLSKEKNVREASEKSAKMDTERANALLDRSAKLATEEMPRALDMAIVWLKHAEKEYAAHAYGPFWDGVEKAAHGLDFFNKGLQGLAQNTDEYYGLLKGRSHNFPLICEGSSVLPDPRPVLQELARVARMGQTNIDFAKIWEHRQTREVLIVGFRSLGEGLNNLASAVQGSMAALEGSISANLQQLAGEEIRSRQAYITVSTRQTQLLEEQNRKLHRIEQDRKRL